MIVVLRSHAGGGTGSPAPRPAVVEQIGWVATARSAWAACSYHSRCVITASSARPDASGIGIPRGFPQPTIGGAALTLCVVAFGVRSLCEPRLEASNRRAWSAVEMGECSADGGSWSERSVLPRAARPEPVEDRRRRPVWRPHASDVRGPGGRKDFGWRTELPPVTQPAKVRMECARKAPASRRTFYGLSSQAPSAIPCCGSPMRRLQSPRARRMRPPLSTGGRGSAARCENPRVQRRVQVAGRVVAMAE